MISSDDTSIVVFNYQLSSFQTVTVDDIHQIHHIHHIFHYKKNTFFKMDLNLAVICQPITFQMSRFDVYYFVSVNRSFCFENDVCFLSAEKWRLVALPSDVLRNNIDLFLLIWTELVTYHRKYGMLKSCCVSTTDQRSR